MLIRVCVPMPTWFCRSHQEDDRVVWFGKNMKAHTIPKMGEDFYYNHWLYGVMSVTLIFDEDSDIEAIVRTPPPSEVQGDGTTPEAIRDAVMRLRKEGFVADEGDDIILKNKGLWPEDNYAPPLGL